MGRENRLDGGAPPTVGLGPAGAADEGPPTLGRGDHVGRFVVLKTLGVGGMGVVVAAYDPKLDRKVALKLLRPDVAPTEGATAARSRLLREAQAMAKLRHPSVVTVFEVGEYEDKVFLAMEYVAGGTLSEWAQERRAEPLGWRRILAAFVSAGRGLVAAHGHGLVHRDFKPANVLVEGDRFQVTDFGIASIAGSDLVDPPLVPERDTSESANLSGTGVLLGTAPYMAAELIEGGPADEKTDQFAFCVALFECLYGQRPFAGRGPASYSESITQGHIELPDTDYGVPDWVQRAVLRGLANDRGQRWASMADLVETLASPEHADIGRSARVAIAAAIGAAFVALPFVAKWLGPPFDRSTYAGAVGQTLALIAILLVMAYAARNLIRATAINRKAFAAVLAVLLMQIPLELGNAALGVPVVASDIQHIVLWSAMAGMFGVTTDKRFLILSAAYLLCLPPAVIWPQYHLLILGLSNAIFIVFAAMIWRRAPAPLPG